MALTHTTSVRNTLAEAISTAIDAGTGPGQIVIMTSGEVEVATLTFGDPAFGAPSNGAITANAITDDTNATGGTAALFKVIDSNGTEVYRGTVGTSGADLNLPTTDIQDGDTIGITYWVYTASA